MDARNIHASFALVAAGTSLYLGGHAFAELHTAGRTEKQSYLVAEYGIANPAVKANLDTATHDHDVKAGIYVCEALGALAYSLVQTKEGLRTPAEQT